MLSSLFSKETLMTHRYGSVFVGEEEPEAELPILEPPGWWWVKPVASGVELYTYDNGSWNLVASISKTDHTHFEIEYIKDNGLSGSHVFPGVGTLTFTKGILTGFTPV